MDKHENGSGADGSEVMRQANFQAVIEEGKLRIEELAEEARAIQKEHYNWHIRENAPRKPREKGRLVVFVRERKGGLEISWSSFRFLKPEGAVKSTVRNKHLIKGRNHKYRPRTLTIHAKDWEIDHVLEIEDRLAEIRAEYSHVRNMMTSAKLAMKFAAKRPVPKRSKKLAIEEEVE